MKKGLTIFFATLFTFAATAPTMAAVTFSDFNNVPWDSAKDYITTVADLGLMVGQENNDGTSSFRAKDPVTYNETVQLVFNLLKNEGKATASAATTTKWTQTMQSNNIPTWAYDAVAYCLENGIVTSKELTTFMANSGTANNATREDVAVFFGKALSIDHRISEDPTLTFTDKNSVSLSAAPYVELLARLEILVGDEYGNFNPKKEINRAEMAVVTTKTYNNISDESVTVKRKTVEGTIYEVKTNGSQIGLMLNNSNSYFYGTKDTKTSYQNYDYNFSNLVVGDKVSIEYIGSSIIAVELISTASSEKSVSGTLNNITTKRVIVDKLDQSTNGYNLASNVEIFLNEKAANVGKITKLLENGVTSTVIVTLNQSGEAATISVTGKENLVEGHINNISSSEITIKRNVSTEKAYTISKYATATFEGKVSTVSHVIDAMRTYGSIYVVAEIDDNLTVQNIDASFSQVGGTAQGPVKSITDNRITLLISGTDTTNYNLADDVYVVFAGNETTLTKLINRFSNGTAMTANIYLNDTKKVIKIEASIDDNSTGTIKDLTSNYITITTKSNVEKKYLLSESVVVVFADNSNRKIDYLLEVYEKNNTPAEVSINSKDVVTTIYVDLKTDDYDRITGQLQKMSSSSLELEDKTIYYNSSSIFRIDNEETTSTALYNAFQLGELFDTTVAFSDNLARTVNATLIGANGRVTDIRNGEIIIKNDNGSKTYKLVADADLIIKINGNSTNYTFKDFYEMWYFDEDVFDVELFIENGLVIRIEAKTV